MPKLRNISHMLAMLLASLMLGVVGSSQCQTVSARTNPIVPTSDIRPEYTYSRGNYTGAGVVQNAQSTPVLKAEYHSEAGADPWKGGILNIDWTDYLDLRMGGGQLLNAGRYGFGFVAHVNLPERIQADDVLAAMDFSTAKLTVKSAVFPLKRENFEKIGPHTLRLTMRAHNGQDLTTGVMKVLQDIIGDGFDLTHVYVNFNIDVSIAKLTVDGQPDDPSPNQVLTKDHFAPQPDKRHVLSVDFYGADEIKEGAVGALGWSPTGYLYANLNADGSFMASNRATTEMKTWNSYVSPFDNQGIYNTFQDPAEVVDGSAANLPGSVDQRSVSLKYRDGAFAAQPANRFDRVVNYFTHQNVTQGAHLAHTPVKTPGYNQPTRIIYSGTDRTGTALSPVALQVTDSHQNNGEFKLTNISNTVLSNGEIIGTPIRQATDLTMQGYWQAPDLDHGELHYRVLALKPGQSLADATPVAGRNDLLFQKITNTPDYTQKHDVNAVLAGLPVGRYVLDTKVIDEAEPDLAKWTSQQYLAHPDQIAYPPVISVVDFPALTLSSQVTNATTSESGPSISALSGDQIHSMTSITAGAEGTSTIDQPQLQLQVPTGTTYQVNSLSVSINGQSPSGIKATFENGKATLDLPEPLKANDNISVSLDYHVNDLSDQTLTAIPVVLTGKVSVATDNGTGSAPMVKASNAITVKLPAAELKLIQVPASFTFGHTVDLPYLPVDLDVKSNDLGFSVWDSRTQNRHDWQITASLSQPFATASGMLLPTAQLYYDTGSQRSEIGPNQATPIYTHTGNAKGLIAVQLAHANKIVLHVAPNAGIQADVAYQGEILWQLVDGPS